MNITICVPSPNEQDEIMERLNTLTHPLNILIASTRRTIDLLKEYRTRLIADVVTGKVDVREAAKRLEEETVAEAEVMEATA